MTITLPDSMRSNLEQTARSHGFTSVDAYMIFLILEQYAEELSDDEEEDNDIADFTPPGGANYRVDSREELEAKLTEGTESGPAVKVTTNFWTERRKALAERLANRARDAV